MPRLLLPLWLATSAVAFDELGTCEDDVDLLIDELDAHYAEPADRTVERGTTCEDELAGLEDEWDGLHRVEGTPDAEGASCVQRCSCGYCLRWSSDHVGEDGATSAAFDWSGASQG